jgi:D-glycero-D-manno-heptose 1,7-bisphosphate phosphatase
MTSSSAEPTCGGNGVTAYFLPHDWAHDTLVDGVLPGNHAAGSKTASSLSADEEFCALREILGRPFIYHLLDRLAGSGLKRVVLCILQTDVLASFLGSSYRGMELLYSRADAALGTGGALKLALLHHPSSLALTFSVEVLTDADLSAFLRWFAEPRHQGALGALLLVPALGNVAPGGVTVGVTGQAIVGAGQGVGPGFVPTGISLLRPQALAGLEAGAPASLTDSVFPALAAQGMLCTSVVPARVLDLGQPASLALAGRFLLGEPLARHFLSDQVAPGFEAAVFLDRDGTVIKDKHYLNDPAGVELLPDAAEGLRRMRALGLRLVLVSNQSGVGRGYFTRGNVERVQGRLVELLEEEGVRLDALYICPHAPNEECACRKPLPGMIERACQELGLDARRSFVIGDKPCDVDLGLAVQATTFLVTTGQGTVGSCRPHHVSVNLLEAARVIETILGSTNEVEKIKR